MVRINARTLEKRSDLSRVKLSVVPSTLEMRLDDMTYMGDLYSHAYALLAMKSVLVQIASTGSLELTAENSELISRYVLDFLRLHTGYTRGKLCYQDALLLTAEKDSSNDVLPLLLSLKNKNPELVSSALGRLPPDIEQFYTRALGMPQVSSNSLDTVILRYDKMRRFETNPNIKWLCAIMGAYSGNINTKLKDMISSDGWNSEEEIISRIDDAIVERYLSYAFKSLALKADFFRVTGPFLRKGPFVYKNSCLNRRIDVFYNDNSAQNHKDGPWATMHRLFCYDSLPIIAESLFGSNLLSKFGLNYAFLEKRQLAAESLLGERPGMVLFLPRETQNTIYWLDELKRLNCQVVFTHVSYKELHEEIMQELKKRVQNAGTAENRA